MAYDTCYLKGTRFFDRGVYFLKYWKKPCYDKNIKRNEPNRLIYRVLLPFLESQEGTLIAFGLYDFATHL
jgi:hypothetical protein